MFTFFCSSVNIQIHCFFNQNQPEACFSEQNYIGTKAQVFILNSFSAFTLTVNNKVENLLQRHDDPAKVKILPCLLCKMPVKALK